MGAGVVLVEFSLVYAHTSLSSVFLRSSESLFTRALALLQHPVSQL